MLGSFLFCYFLFRVGMQVECKAKHILVAPWNISNSDQESQLKSNNRSMASVPKRYVQSSNRASNVTNANGHGDIFFAGGSEHGAARIIRNVSKGNVYQYSPEKMYMDNFDDAPAYRYLKTQVSNDNLNLDVKISTVTTNSNHRDTIHRSDHYRENQAYEYSYESFPEVTKDYHDPLADEINEVSGTTCSDSSNGSHSNSYDYKTDMYNVEKSFVYGNISVDRKESFASDNMKKYDAKMMSSSGRSVGALASYESRFKNKSSGDKSSGIGAVNCKMIEIAPGEYMRLRGAQETWKAIQDDFYIPCSCICCDLTLFCIQDATYVLCPVCQVVSSMEQIDGYNGGVGLGFTMDELAQWQNEILQERHF